MPVYEYRCNNCRRKVSLYVRSLSEEPEPVCTSCDSKNLTRLFSTFARLKADKDIYENILNDSQLVNRMMANDPSALVEWSRRMGGTEGEKNPEYEETIERLERGEGWENVAADMQQRESASAETSEAEE